ncbi:hypothetical protein [Bradyrhizobium diazoefficiens]|uniref:hypothetical protein n=1 Tax=Bradyrhizobium diazoefficiens TaxID=1355477 RepID=UPI001B5515EB|nr:hypothetical protein [Bradyrhizobium japonicum]
MASSPERRERLDDRSRPRSIDETSIAAATWSLTFCGCDICSDIVELLVPFRIGNV